MALIQTRLLMGTLAVSLACSAMGAGLGDLKKDTEEKSARSKPMDDSKPQDNGRQSAATSAFGSGTYPSSSYSSDSGSGFMSDFWSFIVAGPFRYRSDDPSASMQVGDESGTDVEGMYPAQHEPGQAAMPIVRVDLNWQFIDDDNQAIDGRVEAGYKAICFQARTTKYDDDGTGDTQRINQYYGMLRYGGRWPEVFPGIFEVAFGIGVAQHNGDLSDDSAVALTLPFKYYPADWIGLEFRPAWYSAEYYPDVEYNIGDYDFSASFGYRFVQLRAGYRWLWYGGSDNGYYNNGPYAGLSLSF